MRSKRRIIKPIYIVAAAVVLVVVSASAVGLFMGKRTITKGGYKPQSTASLSPSPSASVSTGSGAESKRGLDQKAQASSTPTPAAPGGSSGAAASSLPTPVGEVLNNHNVSRTSTAPQYNPAMDSTVTRAAAGSSNTIVVISSAGQETTVGGPVVADASGQGGEITWNANKLAADTYQVKIKSQLGGQVSYSAADTLTVTN